VAGLETVVAQWSQWLLEHRLHGDDDLFRQTEAWLTPVREKVLENATLAGDETLLDVGCGDGVLGFGALPQLPDGHVIFSDIAPDVLTLTQALAREFNVDTHCQFVQADATTLKPIADRAVDVVTTRSVLIYVSDIQRAFDTFYRVLKPEGVFSLFEPIHRFAQFPVPHLFYGYDISAVQSLADKLKQSQPQTAHFDVHDLIRYAENAGFREINLEYVASSVYSTAIVDFDTHFNTAHIKQVLRQDEATQFIAHLRERVAMTTPRERHAVAYLWGEK